MGGKFLRHKMTQILPERAWKQEVLWFLSFSHGEGSWKCYLALVGSWPKSWMYPSQRGYRWESLKWGLFFGRYHARVLSWRKEPGVRTVSLLYMTTTYTSIQRAISVVLVCLNLPGLRLHHTKWRDLVGMLRGWSNYSICRPCSEKSTAKLQRSVCELHI